MKLEIKNELYSNCECCGPLYTEVVYLDGEKIYTGDTIYPELYEYICKQFNNGHKHFDLIFITDKEHDSYTQINGKLFEGYIYQEIVDKVFEKYGISSSVHEVDLTEFDD